MGHTSNSKSIRRLASKKWTPPTSKMFSATTLKKRPIRFSLTEQSIVKFLWTDWNKNVQLFATRLANEINAERLFSSFAIEQTDMVGNFLENCGDWDAEGKYMTEKKRKDVWDSFSKAYAEFYTDFTIICIPAVLDKDVMQKTLMKIELPRLKTHRYCVLEYHHKTQKITTNPHLPSKSRGGLGNIKLDFIRYTPTELAKLKAYVRNKS